MNVRRPRFAYWLKSKIRSPEWGSGGIHGLLFYRNMLFYTVAFDAEFIAQSGGDVLLSYDFKHVGPAPRSGGDTYGAIVAVDDEIYFGGWVHAPVTYDKMKGKIRFSGKYSHLHALDINNLEVRLLWKETLGDADRWVGEVSDLIYDPLNDRILMARGDGHERLGVYAWDRGRRKVLRISDMASLKGTLFLDHAVFNYGGQFLDGIQSIDLRTGKVVTADIATARMKDGGPIPSNRWGALMLTLSNRLWAFTRGALFIGDPTNTYGWGNPGMEGIRLFDIKHYGMGGRASPTPWRTQACPGPGGYFLAYNAYDQAENFQHDASPGGILLYVWPQGVRIVGAFARVTGLATDGEHIYIAVNTDGNTLDRTTIIDFGTKFIFSLRIAEILNSPPPIWLTLTHPAEGGALAGEYFGGIPLYGYKRAQLVWINSTNAPYEVEVYEYTLHESHDKYGTPIKITMNPGRNVVDLRLYGINHIVSLKATKDDRGASAYIALEP